jgi:hypothetical protein
MAKPTTSKTEGNGAVAKSERAKRRDLLYTPFNLNLYGRVIDGVTIEPAALNLRLSQSIAMKRNWQEVHAGASPGLSEGSSRYQHSNESDVPKLAYIYGFVSQGVKTRLPQPIAYVVLGDGEEAYGWEEFSNDNGFRVWEVEPPEPTLRFDIQPGTFDDLLGPTLEVPLADEVVGPEGATLLVGPDGRLF